MNKTELTEKMIRWAESRMGETGKKPFHIARFPDKTVKNKDIMSKTAAS